MKYFILLSLFAITVLSSCFSFGVDEFPAEDCKIEFSFNGVDYLESNIEEYSGLEAGNLRILVNFETGGFISITANGWNGEAGTLDCNYWISDINSNSFYESGTVTVDLVEKNYFAGSFVDENNFITNSAFTLRYSEL